MNNEDKSYFYAFTIYLFLANMFDFVSTYLVLSNGGIEINYLFSFVNSGTLTSWIMLFVIKNLIVVFLCWLYTVCWKKNKIITTATMYTAATMLFMAGVHNILILRHII